MAMYYPQEVTMEMGPTGVVERSQYFGKDWEIVSNYNRGGGNIGYGEDHFFCESEDEGGDNIVPRNGFDNESRCDLSVIKKTVEGWRGESGGEKGFSLNQSGTSTSIKPRNSMTSDVTKTDIMKGKMVVVPAGSVVILHYDLIHRGTKRVDRDSVPPRYMFKFQFYRTELEISDSYNYWMDSPAVAQPTTETPGPFDEWVYLGSPVIEDSILRRFFPQVPVDLPHVPTLNQTGNPQEFRYEKLTPALLSSLENDLLGDTTCETRRILAAYSLGTILGKYGNDQAADILRKAMYHRVSTNTGADCTGTVTKTLINPEGQRRAAAYGLISAGNYFHAESRSISILLSALAQQTKDFKARIPAMKEWNDYELPRFSQVLFALGEVQSGIFGADVSIPENYTFKEVVQAIVEVITLLNSGYYVELLEDEADAEDSRQRLLSRSSYNRRRKSSSLGSFVKSWQLDLSAGYGALGLIGQRLVAVGSSIYYSDDNSPETNRNDRDQEVVTDMLRQILVEVLLETGLHWNKLSLYTGSQGTLGEKDSVREEAARSIHLIIQALSVGSDGNNKGNVKLLQELLKKMTPQGVENMLSSLKKTLYTDERYASSYAAEALLALASIDTVPRSVSAVTKLLLPLVPVEQEIYRGTSSSSTSLRLRHRGSNCFSSESGSSCSSPCAPSALSSFFHNLWLRLSRRNSSQRQNCQRISDASPDATPDLEAGPGPLPLDDEKSSTQVTDIDIVGQPVQIGMIQQQNKNKSQSVQKKQFLSTQMAIVSEVKIKSESILREYLTHIEAKLSRETRKIIDIQQKNLKKNKSKVESREDSESLGDRLEKQVCLWTIEKSLY